MRWIYLGLLLFLILFFTALAINKEQKTTAIESFKEKCEAQSGMMYIPKGRSNIKEKLCLDREIVLKMD